MNHSKGKNWVRRLLRPTPRRLATFAVLIGLWCAYQTYFTPHQRAVRHRLADADAKSEKAIDARLKPLNDLFDRGRSGSGEFAEEALSWNGKWQFVKGLVSGSESHRAFLSRSFGQHVFTPDELRAAMEAVVRAYLDDLEAVESEMLVRLRADLADTDRPTELLPAHLRSDEEFRREYRKLAGDVVAELRLDVGVTVGREIGMLIASDVAATAALQAAKAAAAEMGVGAGILGTGAASTVATLGVGMVVAVILDYLLDQVFRMAGYDPAAKIEAMVDESLDKMQAALMRDPGFFSTEKKGALRQRLEDLHEARSKMRRETVARLLKEGGVK